MQIQQEQEALHRRSAARRESAYPSQNPYFSQPPTATAVRRHHLSTTDVLALQQTRGNSAVCRMLAAQRQVAVQREPDDENDQQVAASDVDQTANSSSTTTLPPGSTPPDANTSDNIAAPAANADQPNTQPVDNNQPDNAGASDTGSATDGGTLTGGLIEVEATPIVVEANGGCDGLDLQGLTQASYGGNFTTTTSYTNVGSDVQATGTITCTYTVGTQVTLPSPPSGLTDCETGKVNNAIQTILAPHEQRHVAAFRGYAGRTARRFSFTLPGMSTSDGAAALDAAVQPQLQAMYDSEQATRQAASDAASAALDPFNFNVDCSACDQN